MKNNLLAVLAVVPTFSQTRPELSRIRINPKEGIE
jgi:hypothetical protein